MISVAMATYNGEKYILPQLESIYYQKIKPDEVVIVDDCSKDNTVEIIKKFILDKQEIQWKLYVNDQNMGYVSNFFKAIRFTTGDIIILSDQDDEWGESKVEVICDFFQKNHNMLSLHGDYSLIDKEGKVFQENVLRYKNTLSQYSLFRFGKRLNYCGMSTAFRSSVKTILLSFSPEKLPTHDWMIHAIAACGNGLYVSNQILAYRRYHGNNVALSIERVHNRSIQQRIEWMENYLQYYRLLRKVYARCCINGIVCEKDKKNLDKIINSFIQVTKYRMKCIKKGKILRFFRLLFQIQYFPSYKAFFCDCLYLIGIF